jgi:hypothetical protein
VLEKLAPILQSIAEFIQKNISWIMPLAAVIGVLAVAWNIASIAATLFGVSMAAALWPVLAVIAGIAALIAIAILLVRNWDKVKAAAAAVWAFMVAAWNGIRAGVAAAFNWIRANWPMLLAILTGPIGIAVALIVRYWSTIRSGIATLLGWIGSAWGALTHVLTLPFTTAWNVISGIIDKVRGAISAALGFVSGVASSIANAIKGPLNAVIRAWNALEFTVPKVDIGPIHFGGQTIGLPDIPTLAAGGRVMRTGLALVHEGERFSGVGRTFGGTTTINVTVNTTGLGADAPQIQREVVRALRQHAIRNGPLDIPVRAS